MRQLSRWNDVDRAKADDLLALAGIAKGEQFMVVHAGSAKHVLARAKRWPAANYAKLIDAMTREFQLPVALVEGPAEAASPARSRCICRSPKPASSRSPSAAN
jgi:ADP-heptose:LPS heptosyltransferase